MFKSSLFYVATQFRQRVDSSGLGIDNFDLMMLPPLLHLFRTTVMINGKNH